MSGIVTEVVEPTVEPSPMSEENHVEPKEELATEEEGKEPESESKEEEESETLEPEVKEKPKKSSFKKRIDRLKQRESLALEEANYWKKKALEGKSEPKEEEPRAREKDSLNGPNEDDFESFEEYQEAVIDHKVKTALEQKEKLEAKKRAEREEIEKASAFQQRMNTFREKTPDFDDVMALADEEGLQISNEATTYLNESELAPEIIYTLCKDIDLLDKINNLKGLAAAKELWKLEESLSKKKENEKEKQTTKAPKPLTRAKGLGKIEKTIYESASMSQKEYEAMRRKKKSA